MVAKLKIWLINVKVSSTDLTFVLNNKTRQKATLAGSGAGQKSEGGNHELLFRERKAIRRFGSGLCDVMLHHHTSLSSAALKGFCFSL